MAKNYQVGLVIKGNAKGGVSAVKATKDELTKLNSKQKRFQYETKKTNNSIGQMAGKFGLLKASVIGAVASIASIASGKQFIDDFTQQEQAVSLLDASITSMGRTTIGLSSQLQKLASQIQKEGIIGDEVLIKGQSFLTTYKDITDELLPRTTRVMADLSAKMGGDSVRAANLLGKASMGLTGALSIAGISLSDATKKSKDFEAILGEIEDQVGGTNKALGSASTGGFTQFSNALGDARENIGEILTIALGDHFRGWSLEIGITKENIQSFGSTLKVLVASLATIAKIVMVGGALVLGFKAITIAVTLAAAAKRFLAMNILATSMAYTTGVGPLTLFSASLQASTAATWNAITAFGVLKTVALSLFAAFAGWEIGSYLSEQFVEVRVAGLAFVGAMETGLINLTYAFSAVAPKVKQVWGELTTWLKNKLGGLYGLIGDGLSKVGADDMAQGYKNFAQSLTSSSDATKTATAELKALEDQRKTDIAIVDSNIVSLINHEYAQEINTAAIIKNTKAKTKNKDAKAGATPEELTSNQKLIVSLGEQVNMLNLTTSQKLLHTNLSKLSKDATIGEIAAVNALTAAQYEQIQISKEKQSDSDYYQKIIDGANDIGESWSTAGNVIVNTFGTIGEQLDKLAQQQEGYATKQKKLAADKIKYADDPKKLGEIAKAENVLAKQKASNAMSEISSYRAITDSAANMFSENSKGRKSMQAASDVFTAIELANSALRIGSYAIEAITAAFAAHWPIGFASGAAMIAIMAGLGVAVSGGSGSAPTSSAERQKTQGTGTVLGSEEKSASLNNSFERIEELELDQYAVLREMNSSLHDLNDNITHLTTSFVRNFGKFDADSYNGELGSKSTTSKIEELAFGGISGQISKILDPTGIIGKIFSSFSSTKKSLVDSGISIVSQTMGSIIDSGLVEAQQYFDIKTKKKSFWGAKKKTSYNTEYKDVNQQIEHEMALIFGDIGNSINSAVDVLGYDITRTLDSFVIDLPNISFKDLSGDEIKAELQAMFSSQADLMATYLVPGLAEFQKVGEGLYETLIRIAQEQAVFNSVLEITGNTLADVDATQTIAATQAIIGFAGGIEALQGAAGTFFTEFYSEAEQFEYMQKQLNAQFEALGVSVPATKAGFKDLVSALDPLNEADQKLYAQLLLLSGQTAEYFDVLKNQGGAVDGTIEKEKELAQARLAFSKDISTQLALLDFSPVQTQLFNLQKQFSDYASEAETLGLGTEMLEKLYGKKRQTIVDDALATINSTHQRELDTLNKSHTTAVAKLVSTNEQMSTSIAGVAQSIAGSILTLKRQMADWNEVDYQSSNVKSLRSNLGNGDISSQLSTIEKLSAALQNKYQAEIDSNNQLADLANDRYQNDLSNYQALADAAKNLKKAADDLRFGDLSTFTGSEQFNFSKDSFNKNLREGDIANLQGSGQQYLEQAKNYYGGTASTEYQAIFDKVTNAFGSTNAGAEPSVPAQTSRYQNNNIELQNSLLLELESLQLLTDELNAENANNLTGEMATLADRNDAAIAMLDEQLSLQTAAFISSINSGLSDVVSAINNIEIPALPAPIIIQPQPIYIQSNADVIKKVDQYKTGRTGDSDNKLNELVQLTKDQSSAQAKAAQKSASNFEAMEMRLAEQNSKRVYR